MSDTLVLQPQLLAGLRPDPAETQRAIDALLYEAEAEEEDEAELRSRIEDLEDKADDHAVRAAACRREADALKAAIAHPVVGFDLPLPVVVAFQGTERAGVTCSTHGLVGEFTIGSHLHRHEVQFAAKAHANDAHDGLVVAEGWAR